MVIFLVVSCAACTNILASENRQNENDAPGVLITNLLDLATGRYTYLDSQGKKQVDSLKRFKDLETIYINNTRPDLENGKLSKNRLKIIMFFSFYAEEKNSAAFLEYLASDLVPIYNNNRREFLEILKELPFLIEPNCDRLNAYFGFEGKNADKKPLFITGNRELFESHLNKDEYSLCMRQFN